MIEPEEPGRLLFGEAAPVGFPQLCQSGGEAPAEPFFGRLDLDRLSHWRGAVNCCVQGLHFHRGLVLPDDVVRLRFDDHFGGQCFVDAEKGSSLFSVGG